MDARVPRLWEQLLAARRVAVHLCAAERDAGLADAAGHVGRALEAVWGHAVTAGTPAERAVLMQLVGTNGARENAEGGDPPAPERAVPGPAASPGVATPGRGGA